MLIEVNICFIIRIILQANIYESASAFSLLSDISKRKKNKLQYTKFSFRSHTSYFV